MNNFVTNLGDKLHTYQLFPSGFSVKEVAEKLKVTEETVRRWIRYGKLKAFRKVGRAGNVITQDQLDEFMATHKMSYNWK